VVSLSVGSFTLLPQANKQVIKSSMSNLDIYIFFKNMHK
jgi:hypothetical protein